MKRRSSTLLVGIAFLSFIALGLHAGVLGVAWPSIRTSFALSLDAVGTLLFTHTIGYLLAGFNNGRIVSRMGVGWFLMGSLVIGGLGLLGYALAPTWWAMVAFGLLAGIGSGAVDAGLNTYFAANHGPSLMNWLHACFGLGAALGPKITQTILEQGYSWRWAYALVVLCEGLLAVCFALTLNRWKLSTSEPRETDTALPQVRNVDTLRLSAVWLGVALFFVFTGVEASGGQWPYTLFTEGRSVDPGTASFWVSIYWASLTVGRLLFGFVVRRIGVVPLLRASMLGVICGAVLIWWNPTHVLSFVGLALMGFSLAPLFPLSISNTPSQVGSEHAANAIGFQVAAASLGIAALPGLGGILAENLGLETIGPFLLVFSVVMFLLHEGSVRLNNA
jgi:fucose permease